MSGGSTQSGTTTCSSNAWTATLTSALSAESSYSVSASQTDAAGNLGSSGSKSITIDKSTSTSIARTTGTSPSTYGDSLTFTATVSATAGSNPGTNGTVTFKDGTATIIGCSARPLSASQATCTTSSLDVGGSPHSITAVYSGATSGGTGWNSSTSSALSQAVNQAGSTTTVSCATPFTYNGSPHSCDASWLSNGADLEGGPLTVHYEGRNGTTYPSSTTAPTNAGDYTASASYAGDTNHSSSQDSEDYSIGKATADCSTITGYTVDYDGAFHTASGDCTGVGGPSDVLAGLDKTATKHKDAGVYTDGWTFSNANYQDDSGTVTDEIDQVGSTTTVSCATPFTYNGSPHSCDASWLSNGADLEGGPLTVHYEGRNGTTYPSSTTAPTNAGDYTASASYAGDTNHSSSQDSEDYSIGKATADCSTITGYTVDYDGAFHTASGDCTGVGGPSDVLAGLDKTATKHKDAGVYTDGWTFSNANYQDDSGTVTDEIDQVGSTTTVSCATPFTYNGSPHSCDASWLSNGADLEGGPLTVHYEGRNGTTYPSSTTAPTNAGDYTASASYAGDTNHSSSQDSEDYSIGKATADCSTITGYTVDYDGAFHTASGDCTGVGGPSDVLAGLDKTATKHKDAGVYTDGWTFSNANYQDDSGTVTDEIDQVGSTTTVSCATPFTYNGSPHSCDASWLSNGADLEGGPLTVHYEGRNGTTYPSSTTAPTNAGDYTASASYAGDTNHSSSQDSEDYSIGQRSLTVTADDQTKNYGESFTFIGSEFSTNGNEVSGDSVDSVTLTSDAAAANADAGNYPIVASDAQGSGVDNYDITYIDGTFHVRPTSHATSPANNNQPTIAVSYTTAGGGTGGSGLAKVELWAKGPTDGSYQKVDEQTTGDLSSGSFSYPASQGDGTYRFYTIAVDTAGNREATPANPDTSTTESTTLQDTVQPTSSIQCNGAPCASTYYNANVTVELDGLDNPLGSGLKEIRYTEDGSTPTASHGTAIASGGTFTVSSSETVKFVAVDNAGNLESPVNSQQINIDKINPTSSIQCNNAACQSGYYNADVTVKLTGSDSGGSGLKEIRYTEDGSTPTASHGTAIASGGTFTVSSSETVKFVAVDNAGNLESPVNSQQINIDKINPTSSIQCNNAACQSGYYNADVTVKLTGSDSGGSGLKEIRYTEDGSTPTASHGTAIASGGTFTVSSSGTVKFVAVDNAGNLESPVNSQQINIDKINPTSSIQCNSTTCAGPYNADVTVTLNGSDTGGSGLKEIRYTTDGTDPTASHGTAINSGGTFPVSVTTTVKFVAIDNAGNLESTVNSQTITIDKTAPTVTVDQAATQSDPATTAPIHFTAVFSEPVVDGNKNSWVTLSGCSGAISSVYDANQTTPDHKTFDIRVNNLPNTTCTVTATIAAGKASDAAGNGNTASTTATGDNSVTWQPTVGNSAPVVTIDSPAFGSVYAKGSAAIMPLNVTAHFTDMDSSTSWTYTINWDDNNALTGPLAASQSPSTISGTHTYTAAGVYTINVCVKDNQGASGCQQVWIVVYDPNGGFITGGGWLNVDSQSYCTLCGTTQTGRANFGFNSQYKKGATVPTGETEFNFTDGNMNFHSTVYSWLVVSGYKAQYKGTGTINGVGATTSR